MLKQPSYKRRKTYVIVIVPASGSGSILISISEPSASIDGSVTLRNLSLSSASLALLGENIIYAQVR
jgi:hypothetical protein